MAKRKRLTPPDPSFLEGAPETKAMYPLGVAPTRTRPSPPIADVASESAATAALKEVTEELRCAREDGRMVLELPLEVVQSDYLVRDRQSVSEDDTEALMNSLRARGQQTPIEVMEIAEGRYGLISGWRRLSALRRLQRDEGGAGTVLALLRRPEQSGDAYQAMVEENEIRVGLSYFERARIAAKAVEQGVFETEKKALLSLFASASRAKRSKIRSFLSIVHQLEDVLHFPEALGERAGLALAKALDEDTGLAARLRTALAVSPPSDAAAELALVQKLQKQSLNPPLETKSPMPSLPASKDENLLGAIDYKNGIQLELFADGALRLSGEGATGRFQADLRKFLEAWRE